MSQDYIGAARPTYLYIYIAGTVLLLIAPLIGLYPVLGTNMLCFAIFATGYYLLLGCTGLPSLGHAAFFGVGGYLAGYGIKVIGITPEVALLAGALNGAVLGLIMGIVAVRRSGIVFAMVTLALAQIVYFLCVQIPQTGGEDGIVGISRGMLFGVIDLSSDTVMYYVTLFFFLAIFYFILRVVRSPFGLLLSAIKHSEYRVISVGFKPNNYKLLVFVISASISGLAGSLKAMSTGVATLGDVHWMTSGYVLLMVLLGGLGTILGPTVGALVLVFLENKLGAIGVFLGSVTGISWFGTLGQSVPMVLGVLFVLCVIVFRQGIAGGLMLLLERISSNRKRPDDPGDFD